ncbi:hypothetical protein H2248_003405 [Termitomyces sp. 'cryptogamus']|nr:hypothetical protein H2248_003405 [Termitomyces sp. 'cryptogamus']
MERAWVNHNISNHFSAHSPSSYPPSLPPLAPSPSVLPQTLPKTRRHRLPPSLLFLNDDEDNYSYPDPEDLKQSSARISTRPHPRPLRRTDSHIYVVFGTLRVRRPIRSVGRGRGVRSSGDELYNDQFFPCRAHVDEDVDGGEDWRGKRSQVEREEREGGLSSMH